MHEQHDKLNQALTDFRGFSKNSPIFVASESPGSLFNRDVEKDDDQAASQTCLVRIRHYRALTVNVKITPNFKNLFFALKSLPRWAKFCTKLFGTR